MAKLKGKLITFEGNEGCGKSTQIKLLSRYLKRHGINCYVTREPGGTVVGNKIRKILLDHRHANMSAMSELMLYMASRAQLIQEVIVPKLKAGTLVICDRWLDATIAYQGYGRGLSVEMIRSLGRWVLGATQADMSLFLDLPLEVGLRRARKRKGKTDRMDREQMQFHRKVRAGYEALALSERRRIKRLRLEASDSQEDVFEKVLNVLRRGRIFP